MSRRRSSDMSTRAALSLVAVALVVLLAGLYLLDCLRVGGFL